GFTDITGAGDISVTTNGDVTLRETAGDMRVAAITSTLGDVTLTAPLSIIDALGDALADVIGTQIVLTAVAMAIGSFFNDLEIDSAHAGAGTVTGSEPEVTGDEDADLLDGSALTLPLPMFGRGGADSLLGGSAADMLYGGSDADFLDGGDGDDLLIADSGVGDVLRGGAGDDRIVGSDDGADTDPNFDDL